MMPLPIALLPLTWLRWAIFGKRLDEILSGFNRMQQQLEICERRHNVRQSRKTMRIIRLKQQNEAHAAAITKSGLVRSNLDTLLNQHLQPPPVTR